VSAVPLGLRPRRAALCRRCAAARWQRLCPWALGTDKLDSYDALPRPQSMKAAESSTPWSTAAATSIHAEGISPAAR